jgi:hypothetical protein
VPADPKGLASDQCPAPCGLCIECVLKQTRHKMCLFKQRFLGKLNHWPPVEQLLIYRLTPSDEEKIASRRPPQSRSSSHFGERAAAPATGGREHAWAGTASASASAGGARGRSISPAPRTPAAATGDCNRARANSAPPPCGQILQ